MIYSFLLNTNLNVKEQHVLTTNKTEYLQHTNESKQYCDNLMSSEQE